jgi:hypothetical protein
MVSAWSLWLPVLLSAVFVFVASSIVHMALRYHQNDFRKLEREDEVMAALRPFDIPPGDYGIPCGGSMENMRSAEYKEKLKAGPVAVMTVIPSGPVVMGPYLTQWFVFVLVVSAFTAYVTGHALPPGAGWRGVFRIAGCVSFASYSLALIPLSIWYRRSWATTSRSLFDGLIYGALTAATFAWLWPPR